ncbi:putative G-protein coupled receptor C06G4.5 [Aphelenchoides bicaudatus]|nr:putative G-protein coupled receptor C06G4.5 [Aphelenchoides bicaudatus]
MSVERFFVICRPFKWFCCRRKRVSSVLLIVFVLLIIIIILCTPIISYAKTSEVITVRDGTPQKLATLCISALPDQLMSVFITYMFILGFVLPGFIISACYFCLIRHLKKTDGQRLFVSNYTKQVVRSVLIVVLFHFCCWIPFWLFVILPLLAYLEVVQFEFLELESFQTVRMISSFLPYLNSACNWIFYTKALRHAPLINQPRRFQPTRGPRFLLTNYTANTRV